MQNWHASINSHSRLDFYKHFKSLVTQEKYLNIDIKFHLRKSLARFRCSSHKFKIETGCHQNISREDRICSFCFKADKTRIVENEYHAFLICWKYSDLRTQYLFSWYNGNNHPDVLYSLLQETNVNKLRLLCTYVAHLMRRSDQIEISTYKIHI